MSRRPKRVDENALTRRPFVRAFSAWGERNLRFGPEHPRHGSQPSPGIGVAGICPRRGALAPREASPLAGRRHPGPDRDPRRPGRPGQAGQRPPPLRRCRRRDRIPGTGPRRGQPASAVRHPRRASRPLRRHRSQRLPPPLPPRRWSRAGHEPDRLAVVRRAGNDRFSLRHSGERTGSGPPCPRGGARGDRPRLQPVSAGLGPLADSTARRAIPFARAGCSSRRCPWRSDAAEATDGILDPTIGRALRAIGYDRDFAAIAEASDQPIRVRAAVVGGWRRCNWISGRESSSFRQASSSTSGRPPRRSRPTAPRAALQRRGRRRGAGQPWRRSLDRRGRRPSGGWLVQVTDDHAAAAPGRDQTVRVFSGGLATSSTTVRRWSTRDGAAPPHRGSGHGRLRRRGVAHGERGRRLLPGCQCRQHRGDRPWRVGSRLARRARAP